MTKLRWLALLMALVILFIAGFQVYWLRDNYVRAEKELETKTGLLFRETYRAINDSMITKRIYNVIYDTTEGTKVNPSSKIRINNTATRVINQLRKRRGDSLHTNQPGRMIITLAPQRDDSAGRTQRFPMKFLDSANAGAISTINFVRTSDSSASTNEVGQRSEAKGNGFTYTQTNQVVLSLDMFVNDSVQLSEFNRRFTQVLNRENIAVPFEIIEREEGERKDTFRRVLDIPATPEWMRYTLDSGPYQLQLGKTYPYLLKQLSLPILFSVFLVGLTVFSFVLLYRGMRRQQRLAEMKTDLISNITHELKTPIATVGVAIEALKNFSAMQDPARTREYLDISQQELQRLGLLVDKVLKLSMFEKKEVELQSQYFNLGGLVDEVVASLRLQVEKYQARISVEKQGRLEMFGDRLHMQSVVFNLIDNALKYSKENPAIDIQLKETNNGLVLKVTDNGIGVPAAYQQKVFEKFFRVPAGNTHNSKGHGLGLSYVSEVVRQHGGTIHLLSQEGIGSTFIITLPLPKQDPV